MGKKQFTHTANGFAFAGTDIVIFPNPGAPVDGASGTGVGFAGKGSICIDSTNGDLYVNKGTITTVDWRKATVEAA